MERFLQWSRQQTPVIICVSGGRDGRVSVAAGRRCCPGSSHLRQQSRPPPHHRVCVEGLKAAGEARSRTNTQNLLFSLVQVRNRTKRHCRTLRTRPSETTPPTTPDPPCTSSHSPPLLSSPSPSSVALSPSRVVGVNKFIFLSFFIFILVLTSF